MTFNFPHPDHPPRHLHCGPASPRGLGGGHGSGSGGRSAGGHDERGGWGGGGHYGPRLGRLFGRGDLRLFLLALIKQQPRHGYELIRLIEEQSGGAYAPSPGAIYPTLTLLEEEGHVIVDEVTGSRKRYAITKEGKQLLAANQGAADAVAANLQMATRMAARLSVPGAVVDSARKLKGVLMTHEHAWAEPEVARVTAIIERAIADIISAKKR